MCARACTHIVKEKDHKVQKEFNWDNKQHGGTILSMQNINRWRSDQFQPPFYLESGQFDTRGLWVYTTNVVMSLDLLLSKGDFLVLSESENRSY